MNLSMTQKQIHRLREQTHCQGSGVGEGWISSEQQMQAIMHRMDKQQGLLYSRENYIQYSIINHSGKEYIYICIYLY